MGIDGVNQSEWPFMAKMTDWTIGAHMGILFGLPNQLSPAALVLVVVTAVLAGYMVPLFGITLVVFLVADVALGVRQSRQSAASNIAGESSGELEGSGQV